jgi:molecular chaperone GrpE (heat shock protein)
MNNPVASIPMTAWEQAVIVIIFAIFVLAFLTLILKIVKETRPIVETTNKSFQDFIIARDQQWQRYLSDLRQSDQNEQKAREEAFAARNDKVVDALMTLSQNIECMRDDHRMHDQTMGQKLDQISQAVQKRPAMRVGK